MRKNEALFLAFISLLLLAGLLVATPIWPPSPEVFSGAVCFGVTCFFLGMYCAMRSTEKSKTPIKPVKFKVGGQYMFPYDINLQVLWEGSIRLLQIDVRHILRCIRLKPTLKFEIETGDYTGAMLTDPDSEILSLLSKVPD